MRRALWLLVALALAAMMVAGPAASAAVAPPASAAVAPPVRIGDSITHGTESFFAELRPGWRTDAVAGRLVSTLPARIDSWVARHGVPRRVTLELGTNTVAEWTMADYLAAVDRLPPTTQVLLVAPYVAPNQRPWYRPRGSEAPGRTYRYTRWMHEVAAQRPNVCVVPWRGLVIRRPELLKADGVHPTVEGKRARAALVDRYLGHPSCQGFRAAR